MQTSNTQKRSTPLKKKMEFTQAHHGNIQLIMGPMFAGKSTELVRRIRKYAAAKQEITIVKYVGDTRYSQDQVATHDQITMPAIQVSQLADVDAKVKNSQVIAIDEGQFYPDLIEYVEKWANQGKTVIISALSGTWEQKPFQNIAALTAKADYIDKLNAVCYKCQDSAPFSGRISKDTQEIVIGGADKYVACCRKCWEELMQNK